jgi:hypothetical protein
MSDQKQMVEDLQDGGTTQWKAGQATSENHLHPHKRSARASPPHTKTPRRPTAQKLLNLASPSQDHLKVPRTRAEASRQWLAALPLTRAPESIIKQSSFQTWKAIMRKAIESNARISLRRNAQSFFHNLPELLDPSLGRLSSHPPVDHFDCYASRVSFIQLVFGKLPLPHEALWSLESAKLLLAPYHRRQISLHSLAPFVVWGGHE